MARHPRQACATRNPDAPAVELQAGTGLGQPVDENPTRTRFLRDAEARGCRVIDGLAMLVGQGRIGIEYWTGVDPDEAVMRRALEDLFAP